MRASNIRNISRLRFFGPPGLDGIRDRLTDDGPSLTLTLCKVGELAGESRIDVQARLLGSVAAFRGPEPPEIDQQMDRRVLAFALGVAIRAHALAELSPLDPLPASSEYRPGDVTRHIERLASAFLAGVNRKRMEPRAFQKARGEL